MENESKNVSRKKFLSWGIGISTLLAIPAFFKAGAKKKETKMAKLLTRDGKLVEVEVANIPSKKTKLKDADVHSWVKKKTSAL